MNKYGIALAEVSQENLKKFDVITVPRAQMTTIVTKYSDPITDGSGQTEPIPCCWANGWIVESIKWTQEHTDIINQGAADFNAKYPDTPITQTEKMIW
jgi:hypothetical protein